MNRTMFYNKARETIFGGALTSAQVDGTNALLSEMEAFKVTDPHHAAFILANVYRETGGNMLGIKETVMPYHKDKNPSDAEVIRRLDRAYATGKLGKVKTPYWRDGAFGRGPIQISHWDNYEKFGKLLGVPLREKPQLALDPVIGAKIAVLGMVRGLFRRDKRGKISLSRFTFPDALDNPPGSHPRRIVNGVDGSDAEVSANHRKFHAALVAAGWGETAAIDPLNMQYVDGYAAEMPEHMPLRETPPKPGNMVVTFSDPEPPETATAWQSPRVDIPAPYFPEPDPTRLNVDAPAPRPKPEPEKTGFWAMVAKLFGR